MTSLLAKSAETAHHLTTSLLASAQVKPEQTLPTADVKIDDFAKATTLDLSSKTGKILIIGVPGAFSGTCHAQIPRYVEAYDKLKAKGITEFYVVAVNDYFTMNAWKKSFEIPENKPITFIADDKSNLVSALGLLFDATPVFGGPRSKRFVIIAEGGKAKNIFVEGNPSEVTVTAPEEILAFLV